MFQRVAVVGAGPAGLATVKELLAEGHAPTGFERAAGPGGVFRFDERDGVAWESCRLTSSGLLTAFSDFPVPPDRRGHMTAAEYVDYLESYCAAFDLRRRIRFGTTVEAVEPHRDGGWTVRSRDGDSAREEHFDAVAICSGLHQHPHRPRFAGEASFPGEILHVARYRRPSQVAGKRVLIVGAGESGADVAAEVARHAAATALSLRRGVAVLARTMFGQPKDYQTSRLLGGAAHWIFRTRHPDDDAKRRRYRWRFLPLVVVDKVLQLLYRFGWELLPLLAAGSWREARLNLRARGLAKRLLAESGGELTEQFGTKTDDFVRAIAAGRCRRVPAIDHFAASRVRFTDGCTFDADLVLLATGFETRMPFIDPALAEAPRYLHTFDPATGPSLAFIGFVRPAYGAIPPLAELQARWFAQLTSGALALPPAAAMAAAITRQQQSRAHVFRAVRGRLDHLVDHAPFCDRLAAEIGCKPTRRDLARESRRFRARFVAGPFVGAQFRLVGPQARPELAREVISSLPIAHRWPDRWNLRLRWALSRALGRRFGAEYAPDLELEPG